MKENQEKLFLKKLSEPHIKKKNEGGW